MPAVTEPPGELIYRLMSLSGSSASRYSIWATTRLASSSSIYVGRKMIRSLRSLEKISKARSPRGVCSTTIGTKAIGRLLITSSKGAFDGPFRTSPKIRLRGRSPRSKRTIQRSAIRLNSTSLSSPRPSSVVSQKSVGSRRRAGRGAPPRNRGVCALPEAKASLSWLLTSARCGLRLSVFRRGAPCPARRFVHKLLGQDSRAPLTRRLGSFAFGLGQRHRLPASGEVGWSSAGHGELLGEPVEAEGGQLAARRRAGGGIAARELVVRLPRSLELLGGEGHAGRRSLAAQWLEELLGQHVRVLADSLPRVEGAEEMDAALAGLDQLLERGVPPGAVAHELDGLGGAVELPGGAPDE